MFFQPIYIAGQTGSGKTGVSIELAQRLGGAEIINADAYQVYEGIEILSAAPDESEKQGIPHHLFGSIPLDEECDAAHFSDLARREINRLSEQAIPIVVGGSGLYLKSITHGLAPTPKGDEALRRKLAERSLEDLVLDYETLDPEGAAKTNLKNRRYVTRNLEICLLTGQRASELKAGWENDAPDICGIFLQRAREDIYDRINRRTVMMFEAGVVDEIRNLPEDLSVTAQKAIGLREIQSMIAGEISESDCIAAIQQITRRYAKRQETWFKKEKQYRPVLCEADDSASQIVDRILEIFPISDLQSRKKIQPCPKSKKETRPGSNCP
ncbi:MAG: tRNA (adenosine(37)-N6)-dimethylallyltransferase MiaA [Verrucomicrobiales bacterium]|nr:tRNA (adenosine(37)-N6)-dimethylallyltransferase MiaA [Verrucomicrobiales bacterium]